MVKSDEETIFYFSNMVVFNRVRVDSVASFVPLCDCGNEFCLNCCQSILIKMGYNFKPKQRFY